MFCYICFDVTHVRVWLNFTLPEHTAGKFCFTDSTEHFVFFICHLFCPHRLVESVDMDSISSGSSLQFLARLLHDTQEEDDDDDDDHVVSLSQEMLFLSHGVPQPDPFN